MSDPRPVRYQFYLLSQLLCVLCVCVCLTVKCERKCGACLSVEDGINSTSDGLFCEVCSSADDRDNTLKLIKMGEEHTVVHIKLMFGLFYKTFVIGYSL